MIRAGMLLTGMVVSLMAAGPALACSGAGKTPSQLTVSEARESVLCLLNQRRKHNGLQKLGTNARLGRAAQRHSISMDAGNFFDHEAPSGSDPISRIQQSGYLSGATTWAVGENIRWGSGSLGTPRVAVDEWMRSPSHREIMLSRRYRQVGIGVAIGSPESGGDSDAAIYTADFGYRQ